MKNLTIEDVSIGDREVWTRTITDADVVLYAGLIGDRGPLHLDEEFAAGTRFGNSSTRRKGSSIFTSTASAA